MLPDYSKESVEIILDILYTGQERDHHILQHFKMLMNLLYTKKGYKVSLLTLKIAF